MKSWGGVFWNLNSSALIDSQRFDENSFELTFPVLEHPWPLIARLKKTLYDDSCAFVICAA